MMTPDPYNPVVRDCFENPAHAGDLPQGYDDIRWADVSDPGSGARLQLFAGIEHGRISALRFRAWGCPHLLAAAELYCREHEGRELAASDDVDVTDMLARMAAPVAKTGRLLLVEDAARTLATSAGKRDED
jgi:NifU-like protein involved in Fe-S cluster formation